MNGMQYHTADGTRIPNLGQKTSRVGARVRSVPNVSDRRHLSAADLSGRVGGCGQCSGVFGRKGGYVLNVDSGRRLDFKREHGCVLASHLGPGAGEAGFWSAGLKSMRDTGPVARRTATNSGRLSSINEAQSAIVG